MTVLPRALEADIRRHLTPTARAEYGRLCNLPAALFPDPYSDDLYWALIVATPKARGDHKHITAIERSRLAKRFISVAISEACQWLEIGLIAFDATPIDTVVRP